MSDPPFGLLVVDKPAGLSSHDVVGKVRKWTRCKKIGHTGTLDPAATGVLVLMVGGATRFAEFLLADVKRYTGVVRFGTATTTYDAEGEVTARADVTLSRERLEAALDPFRGAIEQQPPAWSALRQDGRRAYELARLGEPVELAPRAVTIHELELLSWESPDATIDVRCSSGTYIRSLAHDLGLATGGAAHLAELRRVACGSFLVEDAVALETLQSELRGGRWRARLRSVGDALPDWPAAILEGSVVRSLAHGHAVPAPIDLPADRPEAPSEDRPLVRVLSPEGRFLAIATFDAEGRTLKPLKVFVRPEECES